MNKQEPSSLPSTEKPLAVRTRSPFVLLIIGTIVLSLSLVSIALMLYVTSGAEQLDLSRPGYQDISKQAYKTRDVEPFSESGPMNKSVIDDFLKSYDNEVRKLTTTPGFSDDPIGESLGTIETIQ